MPPRERKPPKPVATTIDHEPAPPPAPVEIPPSTLTVMLASFAALGFALSARALLLLALFGAFVLAVMAMQQQTSASLEVFLAYAALTVLPVTFLEVRRRSS